MRSGVHLNSALRCTAAGAQRNGRDLGRALPIGRLVGPPIVAVDRGVVGAPGCTPALGCERT